MSSKCATRRIDRSAIHITLEDGNIAFTQDVMGRITGAFFEGDGEVLLAPPNEVERQSMSLFTGMAILEERFSSAYFRFNDNTATELQPGLRAPDDAKEFAGRWNMTASNLAQTDAMRLLVDFSKMLPVAGGNTSENSPSANAVDPEDRMLHIRLQGNKLGAFDIFFDSTAGEQVQAGQVRTTEAGAVYYDSWTSFSTTPISNESKKNRPSREEIPQAVPPEAGSREGTISVRGYVIDATVKPPKELDAEVKVHLDVERGGPRCLVFELSRFLHIQTVEANGHEVEFIQNPPVEGTRLARSGNDVVAVILPEAARKGQEISLRFIYAGDVLAEAGKGLLYIGERGTWYPNRGLAMADFDLTFHYPAGWTLVATGKLSPISKPSASPQAEAQNAGNRASWSLGFGTSHPRGGVQSRQVCSSCRAGWKCDGRNLRYGRSGKRFSPASAAPNSTRYPASTAAGRFAAAPRADPVSASGVTSTECSGGCRGHRPRDSLFRGTVRSIPLQPTGFDSVAWTRKPGLARPDLSSSYAFMTPQQNEELHMDPARILMVQQVPAHEAAHQWWGDLVLWSTYRDQWFSEGLANYCALMMLQDKNPAAFHKEKETYREDLLHKKKDGNLPKYAGPLTLGSRLLSSRFPGGYEAISYGRGTWLFHMLRSMLQDAASEPGRKESGHGAAEEPFLRSLRKLRQHYEGKAITTRELLDVFAEDLPPSLRYEGKASLDWFLDGWINGTALPRLELQSVKFLPKANATVVTGVIRQKDAPEDLVTSVPIYAVTSGKIPVYVGRVFADGAESSFRLSAPLGTHKLLLDPNETILTSPK